jgi:hypothetical protein
MDDPVGLYFKYNEPDTHKKLPVIMTRILTNCIFASPIAVLPFLEVTNKTVPSSPVTNPAMIHLLEK